MKIADLMTADVVTVSMDDTVAHVRELFETHRFHHLVVIEEGKVVGVLSDRDLLKNMSPFVGRLDERTQDANLMQRKVHQIMTRRLVTVRPETPAYEAAIILLDRGFSCVPVVDEHGGPAGIVTWRDLLIWSLHCLKSNNEAPAVCDLPSRPDRAGTPKQDNRGAA